MRLKLWQPHSTHLVLLSTLLLCCVPIATAQTPPSPSFEVANVRLAPAGSDLKNGYWSLPGIGRFSANSLSLATLIRLAYDVDASQVVNQPDWLDSIGYNIDAKPEDGIKLSRDELRPRLQNLLRERFHLVVHTETRATRGYALVVGRRGPLLTHTQGDHFTGEFTDVSPGQMRGFNWSMPQLAKYLTRAAGFPVIDQTGIAGSYDIGFSYNPKPEAENTLPVLDVALEQATGLLLKPQKVMVENIVFDSADKVPTEN